MREGRTFFNVNDLICPFCQQKTDEAFEKSLSEYFNESFERDSRAIAVLLDSYKSEAARVLQEAGQILANPSNFLDVKIQERIRFTRRKVTLEYATAGQEEQRTQSDF